MRDLWDDYGWIGILAAVMAAVVAVCVLSHEHDEDACRARGGILHCQSAYKSEVCGCYTRDGRLILDEDDK